MAPRRTVAIGLGLFGGKKSDFYCRSFFLGDSEDGE